MGLRPIFSYCSFTTMWIKKKTLPPLICTCTCMYTLMPYTITIKPCMPTIYGSNNFCVKGHNRDIGFMCSHIKSIQWHSWQIILWLHSFSKEHEIWWLNVWIILLVIDYHGSSRKKMINISFLFVDITECSKILT